MEKVGYIDFIGQVSSFSGYTSQTVTSVLESAAVTVRKNLDNGKATTVFKGMVVYPATKKDCNTTFARARFGKFFKDLNSAIL